MTERNVIPATAVKIEWNTNPTHASTDPASQRAAGWDVDEIPGSDEFNFIQTMIGDFFVWLRACLAREWTEVSEGIAATSYRDLFRVVPPTAGIADRGAAKFHVQSTATGIGNVYQLRTDGEQLYYIAGTGQAYLVIASPVDGSALDDIAIGFAPTALACDGLAIYLGGNAGNPGLRKYDREGGFLAAGGTEFGHNEIASNGVYAIGALQATNPNRITFWTVATPTEEGQANDTGPVLCVAIDADQGYTARVGNVLAWTLSTRANAWGSIIPTTTDATPVAIAADGDYVYIVTDLKTLIAGGVANLYCYSRHDGSLRWTLNVDAADLIDVAVDDRYLWVVASGGLLYQIRLGSQPGVVGRVAPAARVVTDGVHLYGTSGTDAAYLYGIHAGEPTKLFMRATGNDPNRRPFFNLAIPA